MIVKRIAVLSPLHLPPAMRDLGVFAIEHPAVTAYDTDHGWLMWVPSDPVDSDALVERVPPEILAIQFYVRDGRRWGDEGFDYVLFDDAADPEPDLPTWARDVRENTAAGDQPDEAQAAAGRVAEHIGTSGITDDALAELVAQVAKDHSDRLAREHDYYPLGEQLVRDELDDYARDRAADVNSWGVNGQAEYLTDLLGEQEAIKRVTAAARTAVERLVAVAAELGVSDVDLDELVHDLHDETASRAYNNGEGPADDEQAHDELHDAAGVAASEVNNSGLARQVGFLIEQLGETDAEARIRSIANEQPATVACKFCHNQAPAATARRHDGGYVGECCWDERLNTTA